MAFPPWMWIPLVAVFSDYLQNARFMSTPGAPTN
jgi:hypothetical protein